MVNVEHKRCLLEKKLFVDKLSFALSGNCGQVVDVRYEAYESENDSEPREFIIITFFGGAISVRNVHMNSHSAILRELGRLVDGDYYDEVDYYNRLRHDDKWELIF